MHSGIQSPYPITEDTVSRLAMIGNEAAIRAMEKAQEIDEPRFIMDGGEIRVEGQEVMFA